MDLEELDQALTGNELTATEVAAALVVVVVGVALAFVLGKVAQRRYGRPGQQSEQVAKLGARVLRWVIVIVAVAWALNILGLELGWLTITVVMLVVVAGFTIRPLAENLASGVVLTLRPSFGVGDEIEIDGLRGEIIEFTDRTTVLRLRDGRRVHMPNSEVVQRTIIVYTTDRARRSSIELAISEHADIPAVESTILQTLANVEAILDEPPPSVRVLSLGDDIKFSVRFWHNSDIGSGNLAIDQFIRAIKPALDNAGITFAESLEVRFDTT